MAIWIKVDGTETEVDVEDEGSRLEQMQRYVGGYIEVVWGLPEGRIMVVNEDAIGKKLELNPKASAWADRTIVGDVMIMEKEEIDGWMN